MNDDDFDMFDGAFSEDLEEEGRLSDGSDKDIFGNRLDSEDMTITSKRW